MPRRSARLSSAPSEAPKRARDSSSSRRGATIPGNLEGRVSAVSDAEANERNAALKAHGEGLEKISISMNRDINRKEHHTDDYEIDKLIVRRGQKFTIAAEFGEAVDLDAFPLTLQFTTGRRPVQSKGTLIRVSVKKPESGDMSPNGWTAYISKVDNSHVDISVTPSSHAIIGSYTAYIEVPNEDKDQYKRKEVGEFILLFNPWCKDDVVYVEEDTHREEYVMNPYGQVWRGSRLNFAPMNWEFGQFDDCVLPVALFLLDKSTISLGSRSSPVLITRAISKLVNDMDDDGVLEGNWSEDMPQPCTYPWQWSSSVDILEQYHETQKPVRYGQCWVFSAVTTTLCRALGIPTRSVTNFASAHDTDCSISIDTHWTKDGEPLEDENDSVWNFHVWNESWFKRTDLPAGNDGWQAFDGTPQEASEGVMQCGPAPVAAIKQGNVYLPYDAGFIFSEVNGDRVHWVVNDDGSMEVKYIQKHAVGFCISTKAVGKNEREDLTLAYKHKEASAEERESVKRAYSFGTRFADYDIYKQEHEEVSYELVLPQDTVFGRDFNVIVRATSSSSEVSEVSGRLTAITGRYTGVPAKRLLCEPINFTIDPNSSTEHKVSVDDSVYEDAARPDAAVKFYLMLKVASTGQVFFHQDQFSFLPPPIEIPKVEDEKKTEPMDTGEDKKEEEDEDKKAEEVEIEQKIEAIVVKCPDRVEYNETFDVTVEIKNPLQKKLTNSKIHVTGSGLIRNKTVSLRKQIAVGGEASHVFKITANRAGTKRLHVNFSCDQIAEMKTEKKIYVPYPA